MTWVTETSERDGTAWGRRSVLLVGAVSPSFKLSNPLLECRGWVP